ncbi:MAG: hypothetical protein DCC73_14435 [Proteobacteria bacterium]|nr:MAG: hypothetical protein DCC73_14435 [Pseudomonadota bacterium]
MANLSIRKLDDKTLKRLRIQAAQHGVSMEEEVRQILKRSVAAPERLGDLALRLFNPAYGDKPLELPKRKPHQPMKF